MQSNDHQMHLTQNITNSCILNKERNNNNSKLQTLIFDVIISAVHLRTIMKYLTVCRLQFAHKNVVNCIFVEGLDTAINSQLK